MLHVESTLVLLIIATGLYVRRKHPVWHIRLMSSAFVIDLALLIYIEATRHAVEKVVHHVRPMVYIHVAISVGVLLNYVAMIYLGRSVLRGNRASRSAHRNLGITFVVLRGMNYITALVM
jgi:hypothetical protein